MPRQWRLAFGIQKVRDAYPTRLLLIGRTLRRLLERMDGGGYEPEAVEAIKELRCLISQHTTHVAATIAANLQRWGIV